MRGAESSRRWLLRERRQLLSVGGLVAYIVVTLLAAVLWRINRERFRRFSTRVVTLAFAAIATFMLYPTIPPWLAGQDRLIPPVGRVSLQVAQHVGIQEVGALYERGSHFANIVAA